MRTGIVLMFAWTVLAWPARSFTQNFVATYAEPGGVDCDVVDEAPGLLNVYLVYRGKPIAEVSCAAPRPACMIGATYLSDSVPWREAEGSTQSGLRVFFDGCFSQTIHVATLNFFGMGMSATCCEYPVVEGGFGYDAVDCEGVRFDLSIWCNEINVDSSCGCILGDTGLCRTPVPVNQASWGHVKSLYAD